MPRNKYRRTLEDVEIEFGESIDSLIPRILSENGGNLQAVARTLRISDTTTNRWLSRNGYTRRVIFVKEGESSE